MKSLKVISLGLGQQSTVLYYMSSMGVLPKADYAIFADPGAESQDTYNYLKELMEWQQKNNGIPIIVTEQKSIYNDLIDGTNCKGTRFSSIPAFVKKEDSQSGILRRQCTDDYKITPVNNAIRELYGLKKYARTPKTEIWLGISIEEIERIKYPRYKWQTFVYPLCNYTVIKGEVQVTKFTKGFRRSDCQKWLADHNLSIPPKSSCFFCPYQSNHSWLEMKRNRPQEWDQAITLDKSIRNSLEKGVKNPIYLHRSCKPLNEVNLDENQQSLFLNECDGVCVRFVLLKLQPP